MKYGHCRVSCGLPAFHFKYHSSDSGRNFLNRALLGQSYSEAVTTLKHIQCSSGFSLNIGSSRKGVWSVSNFEVSSAGAVETVYDNGYGFHFNS